VAATLLVVLVVLLSPVVVLPRLLVVLQLMAEAGHSPEFMIINLGKIYECLKMDGGYMIYVYVYLYLRKYTHTHGFDKVMKIPPHYETNLLLFYQAPLLSLS
jgi:hypothetical protein